MQCARPIVTCLVLAFLATPVLAGPALLLPDYGSSLSLTYRFDHPHLAMDVDTELFMGTHEMTLALPSGASTLVWASLPLVKWGIDGMYQPADEAAFGNASLGVRLNDLGRNGRGSLDFGVHLPTAQETGYDLSLLGALARPLDGYKFIDDMLHVHGRYQREVEATPEATLLLMLGPEFLAPVGDRSGSTSVLLRYGMGVQVRTGRLESTVEFSGLWEFDGNGDGFSENSIHAVAAGVAWRGRVFSPGLFYQVPTDEIFEDILDGVVGLQIAVTPGS